jgi:HK97 family phage prohead protease
MLENEPTMIVRTFAAELTAGEGRTVDVRIVPYGETATVADGLGGVKRGVAYQEEWLPGVFAHQTNAANRVLANFEHQSGIAGVVGHGLELRDSRDGFHGSFRLHETADGDKALVLVREGVLGGVSLEARPVKSVRTAAGVVQRVKAHLSAIALCREPAFAGARVLAVREAAPIFDAELLPVEIDPELVERCRRLGLRIPASLTAHPDDTDTPAQADTPDDGTRLPDNTTSQEAVQ